MNGREAFLEFLVPRTRVLEGVVESDEWRVAEHGVFGVQRLQKCLQRGLHGLGGFQEGLKLRHLLTGGLQSHALVKVLESVLLIDSVRTTVAGEAAAADSAASAAAAALGGGQKRACEEERGENECVECRERNPASRQDSECILKSGLQPS